MNGTKIAGLIFGIHLSLSRFTVAIVPSPCINWCDINPENGYCRGCYRTLTEIAEWSELSNPEKREVYEKLDARKLPATQ
jgi:predicted Fe-S protein YdhL (DUF1289 family)